MNDMRASLDYRQASFIMGADQFEACPDHKGREVAFAGRSNSGKSSAINTLTGLNKLARTSKTPGRTQTINFFKVEDKIFLVDLPGYGYAKVPKNVKKAWEYNMTDYLENRQSLVGLVLLVDIRHPMKEFDMMMLNWSVSANLPLHILLTKSDKIKQGSSKRILHSLLEELSIFSQISVQLFSSSKKQGVAQLATKLDEWFLTQNPDSFYLYNSSYAAEISSNLPKDGFNPAK